MVVFKVLKFDCMWSFKGTMYAKDFVREINNQVNELSHFNRLLEIIGFNKGIKPDEEELRKICSIADSSGKVKIKIIGPDNQINPPLALNKYRISDHKSWFWEIF